MFAMLHLENNHGSLPTHRDQKRGRAANYTRSMAEAKSVIGEKPWMDDGKHERHCRCLFSTCFQSACFGFCTTCRDDTVHSNTVVVVCNYNMQRCPNFWHVGFKFHSHCGLSHVYYTVAPQRKHLCGRNKIAF